MGRFYHHSLKVIFRRKQDTLLCFGNKQTNITRGLRHFPLAEHWFKEKLAEGVCIIEKVDSDKKNSDIGTKRLAAPNFTELTFNLVNKRLRKNV